MEEKTTLLVKGMIPARTECPFKKYCGSYHRKPGCHHKGKDHPCDFSCAGARLIDKMRLAGELKENELWL